MKIQRYGRLAGLAVAGALALAACGTDTNTPTNNAGSGGTNSPAATTGTTGTTPSGSAIDCATGSIVGAGSSAQANAMSEWIKAYQQACQGASINYQSVGSGAGIQQFTEGTIDWAGSDSALKTGDEQSKADARCKTGKAIDLPMVVGPVAIAYNLQGVDNLVLDAKTLAGIYSGKITKWNDPAIAALNSGATLPATGIQAFHRTDASGTTDNFTAYLKAAAGSAWTYDSGKEWKAPGGQGAKGSEGVTASVKQQDGAIGYIEYSYAQNASLPMAKINTGAAQPVELTPETAGKSLEAAKIVGQGNDLKLQLDYATKADGAYPIVLVTYEIACESGLPADKATAVKSFLKYMASEAGQASLKDNGYAPLPTAVATKVRSAIDSLS